MARLAMYFTLDSLLAVTLMVSAMFLISSSYSSVELTTESSFLSEDLSNALSAIEVQNSRNPYIQELVKNGSITQLENSLLEQIGEFWATNDSFFARNLVINVTHGLVDSGFGIFVGGEEIYSNGAALHRLLIPSRRLVSGIEKGLPIRGAVSRAYLQGIRQKRTASYSYFGGFVGQGNITKNISGIPADANITKLLLIADIAGDFELLINGVQCGGTYVSNGLPMVAEEYDLTICNGSLQLGVDNEFLVKFMAGINESYIAGGYIKAEYLTQQLNANNSYGYKKQLLSGINGIVNLYDSFYVPGNLTSMHVYLHYYSNETTRFWIGEKKVNETRGNESAQMIDLYDNYLTNFSFGNLDYDELSNQTIPLRLYSFEVTSDIVTGGDADIILITDLSGSMKKSTDSWDLGNSAPTCSNYFDNPDTRRTRAAVCLDKEFVDIVMNYSGNRLWPVFMRDEAISWYNNPEDKDAIKSYINGYYNDQGKGKTCLSCVINMAYDILETYSNSSRNKFVILMSDGAPTHCPDDGCFSGDTDFASSEICEGLCDTGGKCKTQDLDDQCDDCTTNNDAALSTIYAANRTVNDLDVTFFTIGFGPMEDCNIGNDTLVAVANLSNGTYQHSKNVTKLQEIYQNISYEILSRISLSSQVVDSTTGLSESILYPDSYIEFNYTPLVSELSYGELSFTLETDSFNSCNETVFIYNETRILDARIASFSGAHWTDQLKINGYGVFNLTDYVIGYSYLGDPFELMVLPSYLVQNSNNTIEIKTGDNYSVNTGCSENNTLIYDAAISIVTEQTPVLPYANGCNWSVESDYGISVIMVPTDYDGEKRCNYTSVSVDGIGFGGNDTIDTAVYSIFNKLDFNDDGVLDVDITENNLEIQVFWISGIPYMWGPSVVEVRTWY